MKRLFARCQNQCAFPDCLLPIAEENGNITGIICHIKAARPGGPRYDPAQTEEERHSFDNLMLLCARHSKVIDSEPQEYTVSRLLEMKQNHEPKGSVEISDFDRRVAELLLKQYQAMHISAGGHVMVSSPGGIQTSNLTIKNQKKKLTVNPPAGSVASSLSHRNYLQHLIERYNEFAGKQSGREFKHAAIYARIKAGFGAKWDFVPLDSFEDLATFLQQRIDRTRLGSINRSKGVPNYSLFIEYRQKYEGKI
jgi:hypothetical protein